MDFASKKSFKLYSLLLEGRDFRKEKEILQNEDMRDAYWYAKFVIKSRWPEAEEFIKKDSYNAYWYSRDIIKGRWPEAEEYIMKNNFYWERYLELICKECSGDGVISLGIGGADEECGRCNGSGFDQSKI